MRTYHIPRDFLNEFGNDRTGAGMPHITDTRIPLATGSCDYAQDDKGNK
jgi:hypothetical protein